MGHPLGLLHHSPPFPTNPSSNQQDRTCKNHTPTERPKRTETPLVKYRATNWRANQDSKRNTEKALSQPSANLISRIHAQIDDNGRG